MKKVIVKPSKPIAFVGFVGGLALSIFGILYAVPNLGVFGIVWTILAVLMTLYYAINLFTKKGISLCKMEVDEKKTKKQSFF